MEQQMYDPVDTASRILRAAEKLFAEQGFKETTMRQITTEAQVNLAAVNYHFGSKSGLIHAVASHTLDPLCADVEAGLVAHGHKEPLSLEPLLKLLTRALIGVHRNNHYALSVLMRCLEQAYRPSQMELQAFLLETYGGRLNLFLHHLKAGSGVHDDREFFWRLHFLLGSVVFTLSNLHALVAMDTPGESAEAEIEPILQRLVPVLTAGMQAPLRNQSLS
ncbi:TetR/AcrR family transcriptional regulator [Marinobacterium alkalitolerans]|nr:TetR/AcrR family transcriptional regulator [Marinobacterium alkalitolerans]